MAEVGELISTVDQAVCSGRKCSQLFDRYRWYEFEVQATVTSAHLDFSEGKKDVKCQMKAYSFCRLRF